jgi:predicted peroxiredoxin
MADKLIIVIANLDPRRGIQWVPPLSQASIAAAMEFEVEVIFTGHAGEMAKEGIAQQVTVSETNSKTVFDMISEARDSGVRFKVCTSALEYWGGDMISEVEETVGGAYLISEAMDDDTVVFTY